MSPYANNSLFYNTYREILDDAKQFSDGCFHRILKDKIIITLFFENSTRTKSSFEIAAKRLGAEMVHLDVAKSSTKKVLFSTIR